MIGIIISRYILEYLTQRETEIEKKTHLIIIDCIHSAADLRRFVSLKDSLHTLSLQQSWF